MQADFLKLLLDNSACIIPAFLLALLISTILAETLPEALFEKVLASKNIIIVSLAAVIAALLPLCTCGMIPLANRLQKKGASWLILICFLTAGNACSTTALFITSIIGFKMTLMRFLFSVVFGIIVAYVFVFFFRPKDITASIKNGKGTDEFDKMPLYKKIIVEFINLIAGFGPWVLLAILLGTTISLYINPHDVLKFAGTKNHISPFLFSIIGFPFYFCAGSDIPISRALLEKGASIGSVLAFMAASPVVNLTDLFIYRKWLGLKNAMIYLLVSALVCGVLGLVVNLVLQG